MSRVSRSGFDMCEYKCATEAENAVMSSVRQWSAFSMRESRFETLWKTEELHMVVKDPEVVGPGKDMTEQTLLSCRILPRYA